MLTNEARPEKSASGFFVSICFTPQIADKLDVSVDWLLGRTTVMEVAEEKKPRGASFASAFWRV
jgi:hypothetical protein